MVSKTAGWSRSSSSESAARATPRQLYHTVQDSAEQVGWAEAHRLFSSAAPSGPSGASVVCWVHWEDEDWFCWLSPGEEH